MPCYVSSRLFWVWFMMTLWFMVACMRDHNSITLNNVVNAPTVIEPDRSMGILRGGGVGGFSHSPNASTAFAYISLIVVQSMILFSV